MREGKISQIDWRIRRKCVTKSRLNSLPQVAQIIRSGAGFKTQAF